MKPHNPQHIYQHQKPNPKDLLGITRWVNTFRSGDYIGRYLWRSDVCDYQWFDTPLPKGEGILRSQTQLAEIGLHLKQ